MPVQNPGTLAGRDGFRQRGADDRFFVVCRLAADWVVRYLCVPAGGGLARAGRQWITSLHPLLRDCLRVEEITQGVGVPELPGVVCRMPLQSGVPTLPSCLRPSSA